MQIYDKVILRFMCSLENWSRWKARERGVVMVTSSGERDFCSFASVWRKVKIRTLANFYHDLNVFNSFLKSICYVNVWKKNMLLFSLTE